MISYKKILQLQTIDESITEPLLRRAAEIEILSGKSLMDLPQKEVEELFMKYKPFYEEYSIFDMEKIEQIKSFKIDGVTYTIPENIKESISWGQFTDIDSLSKSKFLENFPLILAILVLGRDAKSNEFYELSHKIEDLDYKIVFGALVYFENKKKVYMILSNTYQVATENLTQKMEMVLNKTLEKGSVGIVSWMRYRVVMWLKNSKLFNSIF